jgi:signal transduction histidine kinase
MNRKGSILVVDDAPDAHRPLADLLLAKNYRVQTADSGEQALRATAATPPDLILLSTALPDLDGFEVCRRLKAQPRTRDIPVIFIGAVTAMADKVRGFELGAVDFVIHPIQQEELLARVNTHLELHRLRHRLEHMVMDNTRQLRESRDMLRELSVRREHAREEERRHIAREIHDDLGQMLGGLRMRLSTLMLQAPPGSAALTSQLQDLMGLTDQTLRVVREVVSKLRTPVLDAGIVPGLEWLINEFQRSSGLVGRLTLSSASITLPDDIATTLFRIAQESLTNVTRHAQARQVDIALDLLPLQCRMEIRDDGQGFDPGRVRHKAFGLEGMRERCHILGGQLSITSAPGQGTAIRVQIPLPRSRDAGLPPMG